MKTPYTREDFTNKNEVRWCPGCGDYAILMALQRLLPELGLPPEKHVFVSGIGCAGRLPYYMNTFGFHTIHGRAPAVATGLKAMRPDLTVWIITGDGDALSIGGNHFIHCLRRNLNVNILLFNNQVYGLTKGQFSPTSRRGQITRTSLQGVNSEPVNPLVLALAAGASFVARGVDKDPNHLMTILKQGYEHEGCSFIEIYQDCNIFNHGAFDSFTLKENRSEKTLVLEEGKPLVYGKEKEWVLVPEKESMKIAPTDAQATTDLHDKSNWMAAMRLARLNYPDFPVPLGVYYQNQREVFSFDTTINKTSEDLASLFREKASWEEKNLD